MKKTIFIIAAFLSILTSTLTAQEWSYWRGPNRNGITDDTSWSYAALDGKPNILWQTNVGNGYSSVTIYGDRLFTMGHQNTTNTVYCINTQDGKELWKFEFDCTERTHWGALSTPVYEENFVYVIGRNGLAFCLDAISGKQIWHTDIVAEFDAEKPKYGFSGSPVVEGELVILNAGKSGIALNKKSGKKVWGIGNGKAGYATPVIYTYKETKCAMVFSHRCLNAVDISDGNLLWSFPWVFNDGADSPDPVVVGHRVFISTAYRNGATMIDFKDNTPVQKWFKKDIQNEFGSSIYLDGYLYVPNGDTRHKTAYLKCIDFTTGEEMWCKDTGHCSFIYIDNKLILLNQWGQLTVMEVSEKGSQDLATSKIVETSDDIRCWTAPVLADGKLYVRTNTGELVCVYVNGSADMNVQ
nr:PQQ-like beta-propeller repeat protein [Bacteroidota bacterium]